MEFLRPCSNKRVKFETSCEEGNDLQKKKSKSSESMQEIMQSRCHDAIGKDPAIECPRIPLAISNQTKRPGVIIVLEKASLLLARVGKGYRILYADEHATYLRRKNLNPYDYRPDIVHEALVQIKHSRLRMLGLLKAVYVKTVNGILIEVKPNAYIPDDLGEFCDMMAELLQKFSIKAKGKHGNLLRVVKNPVTQYLPVNSLKIGFSFGSQKLVKFRDYINGINNVDNLVFVVGTMAHGQIESEYIDDLISVIACPLSAATCLTHINVELENKWKIH